jgi:hypothetical protein
MNPAPFPDPAPPKPAPAARRRGILTIVGMAVLGAAFGAGIAAGSRRWFDADIGEGFGARFDADLWTALLLPAMWFVCVLVHEFGHLVGGRLGGMRPLMLFAGPLHLDFNADRTRVLRNRVAATWGGLAVCAPGAGVGRGSYALLVAGGPLASFLLAVLAAAAAFAIEGWWGGTLFATAAMSLVIGVATLIPVRAGGYMSDGGQLLGLARDDHETRQRLALGALMAQSYAGVRARDWDPVLLRTIGDEASDATLRAVAKMLEASQAEDRRQFDAADAHWRAVAEILGGEQAASIAEAARGAFALGLAAWIGQHRREAASARRWLDASRGGFADPAVRSYAEAAVALADGDADAVRRHLAAARAALPRLSDRGGALTLADSLDDIAREVDTIVTPTAGAPAQA